MWSVWSETIDLYLGQGIAMLQRAQQSPLVLQHPATLPLERVLAKLADSLTQHSAGNQALRLQNASEAKAETQTKIKHRKLRISLSAALCPPIAFSAPLEVTRVQELQQIAGASAAASMGVGPEQIVCEIDLFRPGVAAALSAPWLAQLRQWATQQQVSIASVCPLWALATQCAAAKQRTVRGFVLQEPDSLTLLADDGQGGLKVSTTVSALTGAPDLANRQTTLRRWLASVDVHEEDVLKLSFGPQARTRMPHGPQLWAAYWSSP